MTSSKILSPGTGAHPVRQKDLRFDRSSARTGGEAEVIMEDSFLKDRINACQLHNSLSSRGRGELQLAGGLELYLAVPGHIEVLFQLLSHPEPTVHRCVPTLMPPAVWR